MLKLLGFFTFVCFSHFLIAQTKATLAFGNSIKTAQNIQNGDVAMYESAALSGTRGPELCLVIERNEWEKVMREKNFQKTEEFLNGKITPQGQALGADYVLVLDVQSADIKDERTRYENKKKDGSIDAGWNRSVSYTVILGVKIISIKDGEVKHSKTITIKESSSSSDKNGNFSTAKEEIAASLKPNLAKDCSCEFARFMYDVFPPEIKVIQLEEIKKEKAEQILCSTSAILPRNGILSVYVEEVVAGYVRQKEIGKLRVLEMQGDNLVLCDVQKGGEEILIKMNAKNLLKCKSEITDGNIFRRTQIPCD
jgi:hypothetical protein